MRAASPTTSYVLGSAHQHPRHRGWIRNTVATHPVIGARKQRGALFAAEQPTAAAAGGAGVEVDIALDEASLGALKAALGGVGVAGDGAQLGVQEVGQRVGPGVLFGVA